MVLGLLSDIHANREALDDIIQPALARFTTGTLCVLLDEVRIAYGHVSTDGSHVAGLVTSTAGGGTAGLCVIEISGGACAPVGDGIVVDGTHGAAISWSPDDQWIVVLGSQPWLVDPLGVVPPVALPGDGPGTWQRLAP